jgi:hypothetical protein
VEVRVGQRTTDAAQFDDVREFASEANQSPVPAPNQQYRWEGEFYLQACVVQGEVRAMNGDGFAAKERKRGAHDLLESVDPHRRRRSLLAEL